MENNIQVVGRVVLPVRESIKTEAEVAAVELVGGLLKLLPLESTRLQRDFEVWSNKGRFGGPVLGASFIQKKRKMKLGEYMPGRIALKLYRHGEHFVLNVQNHGTLVWLYTFSGMMDVFGVFVSRIRVSHHSSILKIHFLIDVGRVQSTI